MMPAPSATRKIRVTDAFCIAGERQEIDDEITVSNAFAVELQHAQKCVFVEAKEEPKEEPDKPHKAHKGHSK